MDVDGSWMQVNECERIWMDVNGCAAITVYTQGQNSQQLSFSHFCIFLKIETINSFRHEVSLAEIDDRP